MKDSKGYASAGKDLFCSGQAGMLGVVLDPDFEKNRMLYLYSTSNKYHGSGCKTNFERCDGNIVMKGNEVFRIAVNTLGRIVEETLAANNMTRAEIDWLVPHQANTRIIGATAKKLKMSMDHVVMTLENQGNTSSASVPLALNEAVRDGRIKRGQTILLEAFGGGFTWGSALIKY